jgi:cobalt-zinc-cadmium efflux system protein
VSLLFVDFPALDPILAVLITIYILSNVVRNLKSMLPIFLQAVPDNVSLDTIVNEIESIPRVRAVHHAHIWSLDGEHNVFTAHLELDCQPTTEAYIALKETIRYVVERHGLYHSTIEIEFSGEVCRNVLPPR